MSGPRDLTRVPLSTWLAYAPGGTAHANAAPPPAPPPWDRRFEPVLPEPLPAHPGLWLDRFLVEPPSGGAQQQDGKPGRDALHRGAIQALERPDSPARAMYAHVIQRIGQAARANSATVTRRVVELKAASRLLLHPATATSVTEGSLLLHHTYGVPYLPGSALKGICRARARRLGRLLPGRYEALLRCADTPDGKELLRARGRNAEPWWVTELFGFVAEGEEGGQGGLFDFWDALWLPVGRGDGAGSPLARDIVNPHHSAYYTGASRRFPAPTDSPIPTHFLSVRPGTRFLLVVEARAHATAGPWLDFVLHELLLPALELDGIGARTAAGYGRVVPADAGPAGSTAPSLAATQRRERGQVSRRPGDGSLHAILPGGATASAHGAAARAIYDGLQPDTRQRLKPGKSLSLMVTWAQIGNQRTIEALEA